MKPISIKNDYIELNQNLTIHYQEAGEGAPFILIPGYSSTVTYLQHQLVYFSRYYRTIAYDPRGHGSSSLTMEGNHFRQYAEDLKLFMDALDIEAAYMYGQSNGTFIMFNFIRLFGVNQIKAFIVGDEWGPKLFKRVAEEPGPKYYQLKETVDEERQKSFDKRDYMKLELQRMLLHKPSIKDLDTLLNMMQQTVNAISAHHMFDSRCLDFDEEFKTLDRQKIPTLWLAEPKKAYGMKIKELIEKEAPSIKMIVVDARHMMHFEFPELINKEIHQFLMDIAK